MKYYSEELLRNFLASLITYFCLNPAKAARPYYVGLFKSLKQAGIFVSAPSLGLTWMNLAVSTCLVQLDLTVPG